MKTPPPQLVIIGNLAYDTNTYLGRDIKETHVGGAGFYSLIPASIYVKTGIVARVGLDFDFSKILNHKNIDTTGLKIIKNAKTLHFYQSYLSEDGQIRNFREEVDEAMKIRPKDIPPIYYQAKYIHIAANFPEVQERIIRKIKANSSAQISIDAHEAYMETQSDTLKRCFDMVDIAFIDKEYNALLNCTAPIKIIKMGKNGCKYITDDLEFSVPAQESPVIDKTGAGDAVTGAFLANLTQNKTPQEALKEAVKIATASISIYGVDNLPKIYYNTK